MTLGKVYGLFKDTFFSKMDYIVQLKLKDKPNDKLTGYAGQYYRES